ncbi:MAG TPA: TonB-dependent receptor [Gemmatimonadales bacterium]|nr:TonB-dependent receptor [Gemmatimonadales bacterium]
MAPCRRSLTTMVPWLCLPVLLAAQETGVVRGRVTHAVTGEPLTEIRVTVEGTALASTTTANGQYLLPAVPMGTRVVAARGLGYAPARQTVEVAAGQTATADFALRAAALSLSAVVVTGTAGPVETRALGNSITSVGGATVAASQAATVDAAMQGKIAGAQIIQNSGNPGGGGFSVRLRGTSSIISGSEPLYIVDGVIVDNTSVQLVDLGARSNLQNRLADLNPNDIERIEVIRGAAAAALYGSRANNGVVQIFTRRGRPGASRFSWQTKYSTGEAPRRLAMNLYPFDLAGNPLPRYDYQDWIFQTGSLVENSGSVEGGDDRSTYYLGGGWTEETGLIPNSGSSRKSGRINLSQTVSPTVRLTLGANYVNTHNEFEPNGEQSNGVITALLFTPTNFSFFPVNGVYPKPATGAGFPNPLDVIKNWKAPQDVSRFIGSARARWTPSARLAFEYTVGYDGYQMEVRQFIPRGSLTAEPTGRSVAVTRDSRIVNSDGLATYNVRPSAGLELTTGAGVNYTWQRIQTTSAGATDLIPTGELVSAGAIPSAGQSLFELITLGFYAQQSVNLHDRLYFIGAVRTDASSTFGANQRWQAYPKASVSYVLSDEPWFGNSGLGRRLSSLRLRAALGYAGNQPSTTLAYAVFDAYGKAVNSGRVGVVNSLTRGNPDLRPERQREFEIGADIGARNDRLSLEATYYNKLVTDLLLPRPLATSEGYTQVFDNIGEMSNKGIELALRSTNLEREGLRWETTVTYSRNRNRIEQLNVAPFTTGYANRIDEGQPVGFFYGRYYERDSTGAIRLDALGRPIVSATARKIGDPNPDWIGSLLNEVQVGRNLRFRVLLDGTFGGDVLNFSRRILERFGAGRDVERELLPFGHPDRLPTGYFAAKFNAFEPYVEDGSFVKLREISASYRLGDDLARRLKAQSIEVTLAGRNLYTWTEYSGYDPEMNLFGQLTVERGNDFGTVPISRTWMLGVRASF